ncbi:hypothetical protein KSF_086790 [Reticulibacter mediterranei]|uniref:Uncharacterized protein n=1 Tax=Reticulibacter mediterranei TaxID=2778369 RepID=A0A8J3J0J8_9CHLR|nr:helix-turn-helix domain-containing protein [Reticulibacter mediterranei]GHO98631.1 hypothetical protein KSF_086790 [Reticulibacter mediterranei]
MQVQTTSPSLTMHVQSYYIADYEVLACEALRLVLLSQMGRPLYYLPLSPAEFQLFVQLMEDHHIGKETNKRQALERHVSRLKRKLPASWRIHYQRRSGYHLQVEMQAKRPHRQEVTRPWHHAPSALEQNRSAPALCR